MNKHDADATTQHLSVVILTYNEEANLPACLESLNGLNCEIFVVDSGSTDRTVEIAKAAGANVVEHPFENYGAQRNWAQQNLPRLGEWLLHLDADERLTPELVGEINFVLQEPPTGIDGFLLRKRTLFMGGWIKHGGHYPSYHLRLFRRDRGFCEDRLYDQHFIVRGKVAPLRHDYIDVITSDLSTWAGRHVRWARLEAQEMLERRDGQQVKPRLFGTAIERRRWLRERFFWRFPLFFRPFAYWFYRYFLKLGFLDGPEGLVFHTAARLVQVSGGVSSPRADQEARRVSPFEGMLSVKEFGAVGDNLTDDTAALQAAIDATPAGGVIYLPPGTYKVSSPLTFGGKQVRMMGANAAPRGTRLEGTVDGPVIHNAPGTGTGKGTIYEHLHIVNRHRNGVGIQYTNFTGGSIRNSHVQAYHAIRLDQNTFTVLLDHIIVRGPPGAPLGSIAILTGGHAQILSSDIVGFDHGIRASGTTVNITGCRIEMNRTGIMAGMNHTGATWLLTRSTIAGNSFEANDTAIAIRSAASVVFEGMAIQGSTNAPSNQSQFGLDVAGSTTDVLFQSLYAGGSFGQAAIRVRGTHTRGRTAQVSATNSMPGRLAWDVQVPVGQMEFQQTNYALRGDGVPTSSLSERLVSRSLAAVDHFNPTQPGKNLRGKAVPVSAGAMSKTVTFPTQLGAGNAAISGIAPVDGGGTLAPGTYFYIATLVNEAGETGAVREKSVAVTPPNRQVSLAFYGSSGPRAKRRIYRGTASGVYDGYFETDFDASSCTDTGGPFTGMKSPMGPGFDAETSMQEPDADYAVIVTPAWNTTVWVEEKATTGFRVYFGTAPSSDSSFDWFIVR